MPYRWKLIEHVKLAIETARALLLVAPVAATTGCACALFLWSLSEISALFLQQPQLLYALPISGVIVAWLYRSWGASIEGGNSLVIEQIHHPGGGVPRRMAPLILVTTLLTHLCGGSAGREGTAVQMGGSIASSFLRLYRRWGWSGREPFSGQAIADVRLLLMAGVAAGFGGVFGTPLAGVIFALEVLTIGQLNHGALIPCLFAALVGDWACTIWGIHHPRVSVASLPIVTGASSIDWMLLGKVSIAAIGFGLVGALFASLTHGVQRVSRRLVPNALLRPVLGACLLILLTFWLGTRDFLGLSVTAPISELGHVTISSCFLPGGATSMSWFWKLLFTAVTLGTGFKGGEVTPLFFIGAALGNTLAMLMGVPVDLLAAIGFAAVFAGATNTPLASTVMAIELFGSEHAVYYAVGCTLAYLSSGHTGIYTTQRIGQPKASHWEEHREQTIGSIQRS